MKKISSYKKINQIIFYIPLILFVLLFALLFSRRIFFEKNYIQSQSNIESVYVSQIIGNKLQNQFNQLEYIGNFLNNNTKNPEKLTDKEKSIVNQFLKLSNNINSIKLLSEDGKHIFWSTNRFQKINTDISQFTAVSSNKNEYIGQDLISDNVSKSHILSMRIKIKIDGKTYFLSSPYKLNSLLNIKNNNNFPWIILIQDNRDSSFLGQIENNKILFPKIFNNENSVIQSTLKIDHYPFTVKVAASKLDIQKAIYKSLHPLIWFTILMSFIFLCITYLMISLNNKLKKRNVELIHNTDLLKRTNEIQKFLSQINYYASNLEDEKSFLEKICELAVQQGGLSLAVIARPNSIGNLNFLASFGKVSYLEDLIISVNAESPFGQGPSGLAWRENKPYFNNDFHSPLLKMWKNKGISLNFKATATIPIYKNNNKWGILILFREDDVIFDQPMQNLLLQLTSNISIGLDKIEKTNELYLLQKAVDSLSEGLIITDKKRKIQLVNHAFSKITGYSSDEVEGKNCSFLQNKDTNKDISEEISQKLNEAETFYGEILNVRKNGEYFWNQLHISPIKDDKNEITNFVGIQKDVTKEKEIMDLQNALLENTTSGILIAKNRKIIAYNRTMADMLGRDLSELENQDTSMIYRDKEEYEKVGLAYKKLIKNYYVDLFNIEIKKKNGLIFPCDLHGKLLSDQETSVWTYLDATEREQQKKQIESTQSIYKSLVTASNSLLHSTTENSMISSLCQNLVMNTNFDVVWLQKPNDDGIFEILSKASKDKESLHFLHQMKITVKDSNLSSVTAWKEHKTIYYNDMQKEKKYEKYVKKFAFLEWNGVLSTPVFRDGKIWGTLTFITKENHFFNEISQNACEQVAALLGHGLDEFDYKLLLKNIKNAEQKSARTDSLTQLPNRLAFEEYLSSALKRAERYQTAIAVCFMDLDDFKPINDTYGHSVGDLFLQNFVLALQSKIRKHEFLARLGGDEFVLVLENLDENHKLEQLKIALKRIHSAVENIFDLGENRLAQVGMTMGISFYPSDAKEPDTLLRLADAAMYSSKTQKVHRDNWWSVFSKNNLHPIKVEQENNIDLFGKDANYLLTSIQKIMNEKIHLNFAENYKKEFLKNSNKYAFLKNNCLNNLQEKQIKHFLFTISPYITEGEFLEKSKEIAAFHSFLGFSNVLLEKYYSMYEKFLYSMIENDTISNHQKYQILKLTISRIRLDYQTQIKKIEEIDSLYFQIFDDQKIKKSENILDTILQSFIDLPNISNAILFKPDDHQQIKPILAKGKNIDLLLDNLEKQTKYFDLNKTSENSEDFIKKTWFTKEKQYIATKDLLNQKNQWSHIFEKYSIESAIAIPIVNENGIQFILTLYGEVIHQFSSDWMKSWLQLLDNFFHQLFTQKNKIEEKDNKHNIKISRELLYGHGLKMWFQPIVDLYSGKVEKVETLARIQISENHFLMPNQFLAEFGEQELKILFKKGLDQSLSWLKKWEKYQPELGLSINLSPITIYDENFIFWIQKNLEIHDINPNKLTLEILENEKLDIEKIQSTIFNLTKIGVKLAIDDLGAGYSSINRLALLPIDTVKIDQSLIREMNKDPLKTIRILHSISKIAKDFSKHTIIEGLENKDFIEVANILGIHYGQGYGLAKPMKAEDFSHWIQHNHFHFSEKLQFTTWLGAFAYFWKHIYHQHNNSFQYVEIKNCPLSKFFEIKNIKDQEILTLHEKFHNQQHQDESIHNQMLNFLILKIFEENLVIKK